MKETLNTSCLGGDIEVTLQEVDRKHNGIFDVPVIEEGPFVYQIVRKDGVLVRRNIIDFFSVPRNNESVSAASSMDDDSVADSDIDETIVELLSDDDDDDLEAEEDPEEQTESERSSISSASDHTQAMSIRCSEMVEVDHVIKVGENVFLRLADLSGWVAARFGDEVAAKKVAIEKGLWSWCVDNFPEGVTIRSHPTDSPEVLPSEKIHNQKKLNRTILPLQRIYCDTRVKHPTTGVIFYRLQSCSVGGSEESPLKRGGESFQHLLSTASLEREGTGESADEEGYTVLHSMRDIVKFTHQVASTVASPGWVFDRTRAPMAKIEGSSDERRCLIADNLVLLNQYAVYQALTDDLFIQTRTDITYNSQRADELRIKKGDMVVVKVIRHSPDFEQHGNGPFLYLADGSGWLYENRNHHQVMKVVPFVSGYWECMVRNNSEKVHLVRHPIDAQEGFFANKIAFYPESLIQCDRKVTNVDTGTSFYRVVGSEGWVPDHVSEKQSLEILSCTSSSAAEIGDSSVKGWTPDFVRGILATEPSYQETHFEADSCVMTFDRTDKRAGRLNVFLKTQTVGFIACPASSGPMDNFKGQKCKRNCSARDLLRIIQGCSIEKEQVDIYDFYEEEKKEIDVIDIVSSQFHEDTIVFQDSSGRENEEKLRHQLLLCDGDISNLKIKRRNLLRRLTFFDEERHIAVRNVLRFDAAECCIQAHDQAGQTVDRGNTVYIDDPYTERLLKYSGKNTATDILGFLKKTQSTIYRAEPTTADDIHDFHSLRSEISDSASTMLSVGSSRKQFACGECHRIFNGIYSRDIHCREIHGLYCASCDMIFDSRQQLENHLLREHLLREH
ncbi:hypothetical protein FisN_5Hh431 [Fistulifera solaris]|uniref:C2H2-type domain-containing protein n=1 Tax=Fistulifera solaris TaxID=1519565 RepID=A0A1Z5JT44_FISSO|nr:hypothetical protein FisN_5Hh431 [Fistulifera solaris]|eukprot:GAX17046.1 hypothetical protein FisN_5Hh431 [Fistulifera solaris]